MPFPLATHLFSLHGDDADDDDDYYKFSISGDDDDDKDEVKCFWFQM